MTEAEKTIVRAECAKELIEAEMDQGELEEYLQSDMSKSPKEFVDEGELTDKELGEYMDDRYPEGKKEAGDE